jgi:hypothetical protein
MPKMKSKPAKGVSKLQTAADLHADTLANGRVLAIDPSSGSAGSMPGYAYSVGGVLMEAGTFQIELREVSGRLWAFAEALRSEFLDKVDLLIIEEIPPFMQSAGSSFRSRSVVNLHMSVGAALAVLGYRPVIYVPPSAWHADVKRLPFDYKKSDDTDACLLLHATFARAGLEVVGLLPWVEEKCAAQ